MLVFLWKPDNKWGVQAGFKQKPLAPSQYSGMVAVVKNDGILRFTGGFQISQDFPYPAIHILHFIVILSPIVFHRFGMRVIGRDRHLIRIMPEFFVRDGIMYRTLM